MPDKKISQLPASGALADADLFPVVQSSTTKKGLLSAVYTYIASKLTGAISSVLTSNLTADRALISDGSGKIDDSAVTATELGYLAGASSNIQTQINNLSADSLWEVGVGASSLQTKDNGADASGADSIAMGANAIASDAKSNAYGYEAKARITSTTNISGPIINRKDNAEAYNDPQKFIYYSGAKVVLISQEIDFKTTADHQITIPAGSKFYCDEFHVVLTTLGGTLTAQPFVRAGIAATLAKFLAIVQTTGLAAVFDRQIYTPLLSARGEGNVTGSITTAATGSSTIKGRFVFVGLLIESQ